MRARVREQASRPMDGRRVRRGLAVLFLAGAVAAQGCGSSGGGAPVALCTEGTPCAGACVDVRSDASHCGACGNACAGTQECCKGTCVDTKSDAMNSGACGSACAAC